MADWHCPNCGTTLSSSSSKRTCKKCGAPHCYSHTSGSKCGITGCGGYLARTQLEPLTDALDYVATLLRKPART